MAFTLLILTVIAAIVIFIVGIRFMEEGLQQLAGRPFKLFLRRHTNNWPGAITGGTLAAAIMQGSSVVNLMLLNFAEAGTLRQRNAFMVMLGAGLGATANSWLLLSLGYAPALQSISMLLIALAGLIYLPATANSKFSAASLFAFGIGLLFMGLNTLNQSMTDILSHWHASSTGSLPAIFYFITGMLITALIQSSAATLAITLSLLHGNAIGLLSAFSIILGAEAGTNIKLIFAAWNGTLVVQRLAWGLFWIKAVISLAGLLLLPFLSTGIAWLFGEDTPLRSLVIFQSLIALLAILIMLPLSGKWDKFISNWYPFKARNGSLPRLLLPTDAETAGESLHKEARQFLIAVCQYAGAGFRLAPVELGLPETVTTQNAVTNLARQYEQLKIMHGALLDYYLKAQGLNAAVQWRSSMEKSLSAIRNGMYAAKSFKDSMADANQLRNSSNELKYRRYWQTRELLAGIVREWVPWLLAETSPTVASLAPLFDGMHNKYLQTLQAIYADAGRKEMNEVEISTILNFNREVITGCKSLALACKDLLLSPEAASELEDLPAFIH